MAVIRWRPRRGESPFGELLGIQDEINRLFDTMLPQRSSERMGLFEGEWAPAVDVLEDDDRVIVKAELPGTTEKDIEVSILGDTLTIKGEKKKEAQKEDRKYHRLERTYGAFHRSVSLPTSVASDKVKASFNNGTLEIDLPKKEEVKPRQIKIEVK